MHTLINIYIVDLVFPFRKHFRESFVEFAVLVMWIQLPRQTPALVEAWDLMPYWR